ncbi:MAG: VCBS repeat-containing protein, partial [Lawsonibacter sp.]|nr:VCBS repeat-containing protein [Lawsonibacter sp.]
MSKKWFRLLLPSVMLLLLSGCLFRPPDELYKRPEMSAGYGQLVAAIQQVRSGLEDEYNVRCEDAVIVSGDNTAAIQLQDLNGDGQRESAVAFFRVPGVEKSLKIYIFTQMGEDYQVTGIVEGDGAAIYSVDYVDLNGTGNKELVINWQVSTGVYQLGAYTLDELNVSADKSGKEAEGGSHVYTTDRSSLLATELLLTGCSAASESSGSYSSGYRLLDIDQDTRTEIAVVRINSAGMDSQVEVYGWTDGQLESIGNVELSAGVATLNKMRANYLSGEYYPPALYVSCTLKDGSRTTDVLAYQMVEGKEQKQLVNLSLNPKTGVSRNRIQGYTEVSPADINADIVLELPSPSLLPSYGDA